MNNYLIESRGSLKCNYYVPYQSTPFDINVYCTFTYYKLLV